MNCNFAHAVTGLFVALAVAGCAQPKPSPYSERVILLPNRDGRPSAVVVKRAGREQELNAPYQGVELAGDKEQTAVMSGQEVQQRYGGLLAAQPARPFTFLLFFNINTTELTPQSQAALREIKQKLASFPAAQVSVIGHTDSVGSIESNDALSLKRAAAIRESLVEVGIPRNMIEIVGRGERELMVQTSDGVAEERNRRVEVKLR